MKTYLLLFVALSTVSIAMAQDSEPADTTKNDNYSLGEGDVTIEFKLGERDTTKNVITRWFTLGLGVNPVMADGNFDLPAGEFYNDWDLRNGKSTNVDLGIVQQKVNLSNHKLYLFTGVGFDINKYMYSNNFVIDRDTETWQAAPIDADTKKNRLTTTYLHVPLMLNFESNNKHYQSFRINAGVFGGLRLGTNQKIKFEDKDDNPIDGKKKYKERDNYNLNPVNYGIKAELGYGPINLYTKYYMNDMFKDDAAPELRPLSIGIMVVPF